MTFIEALNNEETRAMVDSIEDIKASLDGREDDEILIDCLENACIAFERKTGINLR